jgi:hypothetical protein
MELDKNTFNRIFNFKEVSAEQAVLNAVATSSSTPTDLLFSALQIYESSIYLSKSLKNKPGFDVEIINQNACNVIYKIFNLLDETSLEIHPSITLYPDEYLKVVDLFRGVVDFFERQEQYERCALLHRVQNAFKSKINLIQ